MMHHLDVNSKIDVQKLYATANYKDKRPKVILDFSPKLKLRKDKAKTPYLAASPTDRLCNIGQKDKSNKDLDNLELIGLHPNLQP